MSEFPPPPVQPALPPPPPPSGTGGTSGSSDRTLMVVLAYLGLLALIPYLTKKEDPDIHWHAKNGVGLLILDVVVWVIFFVIGIALRNSVLGCGIATIQCVIWLAILALHVYCLIQAVGGKRPRVPVVTDFAEKSL